MPENDRIRKKNQIVSVVKPAISQSEDWFQQLADNAHDLMVAFFNSTSDMAFLKDGEFRHVMANRALLSFLGKTEAEVVGKTDFELMPEEMAKQCRRSDMEALRTGRVIIDVERSGDRLYETRKFRINMGNGRTGIGGYIRDVTDARNVEKDLKASEEKFRAIAETTPSAIFVIQETKIVYVNPAFEIMSGYSLSDVRDRNYWELVHPDYQAIVNERGLARQRKESVTQRYEFKMITKNGQEKWFDFAATYLEFNGRPAILGTAIDITDRILASTALQKSEEQYRLLIENANEAIIVAQDGILRFVNPKTIDMIGYPEEELLSRPFTDFIHPDDRDLVMTRFQERIEGSSSFPSIYPFRCLTKTGRVIWVEINVVAFLWEGQKATLNFLTDITARREAEERIKQDLEKLEKSIEAIIQVISATVEARDPYTAGHQERVAKLAWAIALEMGLSQDQADGIRMAGAIHDLGKLSIPAEILSKPTKLTEIEYNLIKFHAQIGHDILKDIDFPWPVARMVIEHHERMDGSGYPRGLKGEEILLAARIISVADVVESMASHRPYRPALGIDRAIEEISRHRGVRYDDAVVDACLKVLKENLFSFD